jgi:hypothetical protein
MEQIVSNCFLVVNQAVRWGMDPFAVAQCVSVIHGKLCYEGKLIAAVIEAKLGIRLKFKWNDRSGDQLGIQVSGKFPDEDEARIVDGTVGEWKTTGAGTPWVPKQYKAMLAYRGSREWGRLHSPSLMLGVYSEDELLALSDDRRARQARDITAPRRPTSVSEALDNFAGNQAAKHEPGDAPSISPDQLAAVELPAWPHDRIPTNSHEYVRYACINFEMHPDAEKRVAWFQSAEQRKLRNACSVSKEQYGELQKQITDPVVPAPDQDPEGFIAFIREKVAAAATRKELDELFAKHVNPVEGDTFPPDREEVRSIFARRASELGE